MTPTLEALGRRAVACRGWRWMPGMLAVPTLPSATDASIRLFGARWDHRGEHFGSPMGIHIGGNKWPVSMHGPYLPDFSDPATVGCLLALVREALVPTVHAVPYSAGWVIEHASLASLCLLRDGTWGGANATGHIIEATEAEALVAALEAAP